MTTGAPLKVSKGGVLSPYGLERVPETNASQLLEPSFLTLISKSWVLAKLYVLLFLSDAELIILAQLKAILIFCGVALPFPSHI